MKLLFVCGALLAVALPLRAATVNEDFSTNPLIRDWRVFGDAGLFHWNATDQNLEVTWDSSRTNSYFYLPLKTILSKDDDFSLSFELVFLDYATGTTSNKPYAAEAAFGFLNLDNAAQASFSRGSGVNATYGAKNLVEFDFFPSFSIFLPTIAQVIVSTNDTWLYNHDNLLDMPPGDLFHVQMTYAAATRTLTTMTTRNGSPYGTPQTIQAPANDFDFRVTAFSVSSYSDQNSASSILAHGVVDNIVVTTPPLPVTNLAGRFSNNIWQVQFISRANWLYTLERATNFQMWSPVSPTVTGNQTNLYLQDTNPPANRAFYRVRAERP